MKMRLLLTLAGFVIGFVVPALAQEQNTVDPEVRQQIEAVLTKYEDAFNKNDAAAIAALYTADAVEVFEKEAAGGAASGREAIEQMLLW
jgi:ketosteroid isomerase-like protein